MKEDHRSTVIYATFAVAQRKPVRGAYITAMILLHIIIHSAVHIYHFHIFTTSSSSFHGFITNQFKDGLLPVGLLA